MSHTHVANQTHIGRAVPEDSARPLKIARLNAKLVDGPNGCRLYTGSKSTKGYGQINVASNRYTTHRLAYELYKGPIPEGMLVCHSCDVRNCCNPDHLWLGTNDENQDDAWLKGRKRMQSATHCERGHEYTPETTRRYGKAARRTCLICQRARTRIAAGWPADLAWSTAIVPAGQRPVSGKWLRAVHG